MLITRICILLVSLYAFCSSAQATHIIGGSLQMQHIVANRYAITINYYRDCSPGSVDFPPGALRVGFYEKGVDTLIRRTDLQIRSTEDLNFVVGNCINLPINCVQKRVYSDTIDLNLNDFMSARGYYISYEQCCRNAGIKNIVQPSTSGMVYYLEFPALYKNNRPYINSTAKNVQEQNIFLCNNELFEIDYSYVDSDGDSLVYKLVEPLMGNTDEVNNNASGIAIVQPGPYPPINWNSGYGLNTNVLDGSPDLSIDSKTGKLSVVPQQLGLYVFAILVEEYRDGIKIAESRNELQYFVTQCPVRNAPEITWLNDDLKSIEPMRRTCFDFELADVDADSLSIDLKNIDPLLQSALTYSLDTNVRPHRLQVCADVACNFKKYEGIGFELWLSDNSCPKPLLDSMKINIDLNGFIEGDPFKSIPNVFSPNKDGINDAFYIKGNLPMECMDDFEIKIYNRWGKQVYESRDISFRWIGDGLDAGVYFYVIRIKELEKIGYLTLIL